MGRKGKERQGSSFLSLAAAVKRSPRLPEALFSQDHACICHVGCTTKENWRIISGLEFQLARLLRNIEVTINVYIIIFHPHPSSWRIHQHLFWTLKTTIKIEVMRIALRRLACPFSAEKWQIQLEIKNELRYQDFKACYFIAHIRSKGKGKQSIATLANSNEIGELWNLVQREQQNKTIIYLQ